jgi:hypothetical protein
LGRFATPDSDAATPDSDVASRAADPSIHNTTATNPIRIDRSRRIDIVRAKDRPSKK